jgi:hypothetical protein
MSHLTEDQLSAFADGALPERDRGACEAHLAACEACRTRLAELSALDRDLTDALEHDPGEAYFETFADRVAARIAREAPAAAPARSGARAARPGGASPWAWLRTPRGLSIVGSAAALVAVAGLAWIRFQGRDDVARLVPSRSRSGIGGPRQGTPPAGRREEPRQGVAPPAAEPLPQATAPAGATAPPPRFAPAPAAGPTASREEETAQAPPAPPAAALRAREVRRNEAGADVSVKPEASAPAGRRPIAGGERAGTTPGTAAPAPAGSEPRVEMKRMATPYTAPTATKAPGSEDAAASGAAPGEAAESKEGVVRSFSTRAMDSKAPVDFFGDGLSPCGTVQDARGTPIAGARITVTNDGLRTASSGADGRFCLPRLAAGDTLSILRVGFEPARLVVGPATSLAVRLEPIGTLGPGPETALGHPGPTALAPGQVLRPGALVPAPRAPAADVYADQPAEIRLAVTQARDADELARREGSALAYERSAEAWTGIASRSAGAAALDARFHALASMRAAFRTEPTAARRDRLRAALAAFVATAPRTVPERDTAIRWQAELPNTTGRKALYR